MKRALFISVLTAFGALSMACADNPDVLTNASANEADDDDDRDDEESPRATPKRDTSNPVSTPNTNETPKNNPSTTECSAKEDAAECATCCAQKHNPIQGCACGVGSACGSACDDNICAGELPNFECVMCMMQNQCDFGFGNNDEIPAFAEDLQQCLQQCAPQ